MGRCSEVIPGIGNGVGGEVSLNGLLCGAVSSVAMAIGVKYRRTSAEEDPQPVWNMLDKYVAEFKEYYAKVHDYSCAASLRFAIQKAVENAAEVSVYAEEGKTLLLFSACFLGVLVLCQLAQTEPAKPLYLQLGKLEQFRVH